MAVIYSDLRIAELIQERKFLPDNWRERIYNGKVLNVEGDAGNTFRIIVRQQKLIPSDFSVILAVLVPPSNRVFRLRRYNGRTAPHTNRIEREQVDGFHIHFATERYQRRGQKEDAYAKETDRYCNLSGAVQCLIKDANFEEPAQAQQAIF